MRDINIAVNICTYHRNEFVEKNISKLLKSKFFQENEKKYYGRLQIFVVDNGCELKQHNDTFYMYFITEIQEARAVFSVDWKKSEKTAVHFHMLYLWMMMWNLILKRFIFSLIT